MGITLHPFARRPARVPGGPTLPRHRPGLHGRRATRRDRSPGGEPTVRKPGSPDHRPPGIDSAPSRVTRPGGVLSSMSHVRYTGRNSRAASRRRGCVRRVQRGPSLRAEECARRIPRRSPARWWLSPTRTEASSSLETMPFRVFTRNQLLVGFLSRIRSRRTGRAYLESRGEGVRRILEESEQHSGQRPRVSAA